MGSLVQVQPGEPKQEAAPAASFVLPQKQHPMQLITVGTVAFDRIETPFGVAEKTVGGAATYISLAASVFLEKMGLVSVVGDDFPEPVMADLRERGVDLQGLEILKGKESFFWAGRYHYDMNSRDTWRPG